MPEQGGGKDIIMKINLKKSMFSEKEYTLVSHGEMNVTAFKYSTGVEALKCSNKKGWFIILPFQGQQIWKLHFDGRNLSMKTTIKEPVKTSEYLKTYGGFLYHCGINSFGVPDDKHPQHGEIPNAEYDEAYIICDEDADGKYISVGGHLNYDVAFTKKYRFSPECVMHENKSVLKINITLENLRHEPMEYMYLCHMNFLPQNGARLIYTAPRNKNYIKVHKIISDNTAEGKAKKIKAFMDKAQECPALCDEVGAKDEIYDPEICFAIKYLGDENGRGYTMQYKEGEGACFVSHPTDILPVGVRWISRTADEDAMGMILPATSEHLGYEDSKKKGYLKYLEPMGKLKFYIETGYLCEDDAKAIIRKCNDIMNSHK